jgi:hypothetical protein
MTLGKYAPDETSYTVRAGNTMFFDMSDGWDQVMKKYELNEKDMFNLLNKPAIDDALDMGKTIRFTHDPRLYHTEEALRKEWEYIRSKLGYDIDLKQIGDFWYVQRKNYK